MEVAWNLLDGEGSDQPAPVLLLEGLLGHIKLFVLVGFIENLKVTRLDEVAILVNATLGYRPNIGMMRHEHILDIQRDDFARILGELDVDVDATLAHTVTSFRRG